MTSRPTLRVSTPLTANFPNNPPSASELRSAISLPSAVSANTPLSAVSRTSAFRDPLPSSGLPSAGLRSAGPFSATIKLEHDLQKTPITPPVAYLDFLRGMSLVSPCLASPPQTGKSALKRTSTASTTSSTSSADSEVSNDSNASSSSAESEDSDKEKGDQVESAPSTARTDLSSECEPDNGKGKEKEKTKGSIPAPIETKRSPPTPRGPATCPLSAPAAGTMFPSMKLPASPAVPSTAGLYSPARSPLSAASHRSTHFDWEAALKARRLAAEKLAAETTTATTPGSKRPAAPDTPGLPPPASASSVTATTPTTGPLGHVKRDSRSSIRHIREVVTRTVTYTPRVGPAPKGKRRKIDAETAVKS
ncbi:hypothetical protein VTJ49DRAFT_7113 [Mycothermus thermophilus]|uniref:Uncharacterized protein n=1 Tax=Humicola insolens TaxID=85995 RepID=A0ABR3VJ35_HUMIN